MVCTIPLKNGRLAEAGAALCKNKKTATGTLMPNPKLNLNLSPNSDPNP